MRLKAIAVSTWVLLLALNLGAQDHPPGTRSLTLAECIHLALRHNLDVQIERYAPRIFESALEGSYALYDPTFDFSYFHTFNSSPGGTDQQGRPFPSREITGNTYQPALRGGLPTGLTYDLSVDFNHRYGTGIAAPSEYSSGAVISVRQPLLRNFWIDGPRQQILVNRRNLQISELGFHLQLMNTVTSVELAYYDLIFAQENVKVQQSALELADRLLAENKKRVEIGALAPLDEKQSESQVAARRADLLVARRELSVQQNALRRLLTEDFAAWENIHIQPAESLLALPVMLDLHESWHKGLTLRPDLLQFKLDVEKRDIVLRYARNQLFPLVDVAGSFGHNGLGPSFGNVTRDIAEGDNPRYSAGVIISVPLGNRDARSRYRIGKAEREQSILRLKRLEQDVLVQIDDAIKLAQTHFERVEATRQARQFAEAALDAEQKKLAAGKSTSFVVLQLQRDLTSARSAEIRALADYNKALAQLALQEGTTLQRHQLSLEVK